MRGKCLSKTYIAGNDRKRKKKVTDGKTIKKRKKQKCMKQQKIYHPQNSFNDDDELHT